MVEPTGLDATTFQRLELNAGVFLKNFSGTLTSSVTDAASFKTALDAAITARTLVLGATRGGGTFTATPESRQIQADGMRYPVIGSTVYDSWDCHLTGTMIEAYPDNWKLALPTGTVTTSGKIDTLKFATALESSDYLTTLDWVSLLSDGTYIMITLKNALQVGAVNFTFADKNEGTLPFDFKAHVASLTGQDEAPVEIKWYHPTPPSP